MDAATEEDGASLRRATDFGGLGGDLVVDPGDDDPQPDPRKRFNGPDPNGPSSDRTILRYALRADSFTGTVGATNITRLGFSAGRIRARRPDGTWMTGASLVNAVVSGSLVNGNAVTLRVFDAVQDPAYPSLWSYDIRVRQPNGTYIPACGYQGAAVRRAYAMPNRYDFGYIVPAEGDVLVTGTGARVVDANAITLACKGFAYAKCEEFYPPWLSANGVSLGDTHWACVRALRADTCGDGFAHTEEGVLINVYDGLGYVADTETWPLEAVWDTNGAVCINRPAAREDASMITCVNRTIPACQAGGGMLTTEYQELPDAGAFMGAGDSANF